jgi:hypothetical protein
VKLLEIIGALVVLRWAILALAIIASVTVGRKSRVLRRLPLAYFWATDCQISAMSGGEPGQTISARLGEAVRQGSRRAAPYARLVDEWAAKPPFNETDHCAKSDEAYRARGDAAPFDG